MVLDIHWTSFGGSESIQGITDLFWRGCYAIHSQAFLWGTATCVSFCFLFSFYLRKMEGDSFNNENQ